MKKIQKEHLVLVIKYTGISFITGGLSHGFFSWERQIITSLIWVWFFILGTLLEKKTWEIDYIRTIIFSSILAVAIWALTWWLQHFPDSPDRSIWIVPLWFLVSVYAYISLEKEKFVQKTYLVYTVLWFVFSVVISVLFYWVVQQWYVWGVLHNHWVLDHQVTEDIFDSEQEVIWNGSKISEKVDSQIHFVWDGHSHDH